MGQSDLPVANADRHAKAFARLGWIVQPRRGKGSHLLLTKPGVRWTITLPTHGDVKRGLLAAQIKGAGLTIEDYCRAFNA